MKIISWLNDRKSYIKLFLFLMIISGFLGIFLVQAPNYDLYFYHYYNGWALFNNRINIDIQPNWYSSYFNPILDGINYFLMDKLNRYPNIFLFISNLKFGLFLFLTYLIANLTFADNKTKNVGIITTLILTALSPILILIMRFDLIDMQLANFVLISLYFYLRFIFENDSKSRTLGLFISALTLGMGIGLKYTIGVFSVPMLISCLIYYKQIPKTLKTFIILFFGILVGFLAADGWWMFVLWQKFGNPLFPYFNNIFHSKYADNTNAIADGFAHIKPHSFFDWILMPLKNTYTNSYLGIETKFFEPKMPIIFFSIIIIFLSDTFKNLKKQIKANTNSKIINIMIIYVVLAYYINSAILGNLRYVAALIPLVSIIITELAISYKIKIKSKIIYPALLLILILNCTLIRFSHSDILWQNKSEILTIEKANIQDDSTVLLAGARTSFIVPFQNQKAKYIGFSFPEKLLNTTENLYRSFPEFRNHYYISTTLEKINKQEFQNAKNLYIILNLNSYDNDKELYDKTLEYYSDGEILSIDSTKCQLINNQLFSQYQEFGHQICRLK